MPRRSAIKRESQLLVRLTAEELDVLDAAAHLERSTANTYVYRLLQAHVGVLRKNEFVVKHLENRRHYEESQATTIDLPSAPDTRRRQDGLPERPGRSPRQAEAQRVNPEQ